MRRPLGDLRSFKSQRGGLLKVCDLISDFRSQDSAAARHTLRGPANSSQSGCKTGPLRRSGRAFKGYLAFLLLPSRHRYDAGTRSSFLCAHASN